MNRIEIPENVDISALFGSFDANLKLLEKALSVSIVSRDGIIKISGDEEQCEKAGEVICVLVDILEKGDTVHEMADLKGKTLYAPSNTKGANPEHILNHLLTSNGVSPSEVDIQWMTAQEVTAAMATGEAGICMLPVPAATALMIKDSGVRQAISLSEVWGSLGNGALAQGCIVARKSYVEQNPQAVAAFLAAYEASITYMKAAEHRGDAAALVAQYGITANAAIATKAIDQCNLTFVTGQQMKDMMVSFLGVMYAANPASIGGALPEDDFYYGLG